MMRSGDGSVTMIIMSVVMGWYDNTNCGVDCGGVVMLLVMTWY